MKFHDPRQNCRSPGGYVFQRTNKSLDSPIKFNKDRTIHVTSRLLTRKIAPPSGGHVFQRTGTIFKPSLAIIRTNVLTKVLTRKTAPPLATIFCNRLEPFSNSTELPLRQIKTAPPPGGHENCSAPWPPYIIGTNVLTKFHEDWTINVTSTSSRQNCLPPGGHFHKDWTINVTSRVFEIDQDIVGTNLLTKFHEDQTINVASRVLTRQNVVKRQQTTHNGQKVITRAHHDHVVLR
ncbi:hypothetical protein DPMN_016370 [Dreissena polymorpha]|uniref:Uncharacterized protein n=1 Tax=Dreissena polymorpha TaxID=45954 RepID=A0A9D4ND94_DREPO|nr:hypothetical protein DPMN_016370 [Dreissena polymorpha]